MFSLQENICPCFLVYYFLLFLLDFFHHSMPFPYLICIDPSAVTSLVIYLLFLYFSSGSIFDVL